MNDQELRAGVVACIRSIAPEVDADDLAPDRPLRVQVDLDSMDWLNVILALDQRFGVPIPEADYPKLTTLYAIVHYLADRSR